MRMSIDRKWQQICATIGLCAVLGACNSTDPTLGVEQPTNDATSNAQSTTVTTSAPTPSPEPSQAPAETISNVFFAPVVGAPVDSVTALSAGLSSVAPLKGIKLEPSSSISINHEVRGYFSALSEGGTITVIHVWDIFTPQGQRVHRIQGQEKIVGAASDPWQAVSSSTMQEIANKMLTEYVDWLGEA